MNTIYLFTDVSLSPKLKFGFGAYLLLDETSFNVTEINSLRKNVKLRKFESTSSTKLEICTLLWALDDLRKIVTETPKSEFKSKIYTDSQCITGLQHRRTKLEKSNYISSKNRELNNAAQYKKFYFYQDMLKFDVIKVKGHSKSFTKDRIHQIFAIVDTESRKKLKAYLNNPE